VAERKKEFGPAGAALGGLVGGLLLAFGLALALAAVKGWLVTLLYSPYCAAAGSLAGGLFVGRRLGQPSPLGRLTGLGVGLIIGLIVPLAAWRLAPSLGYQVGRFTAGPQVILGAGCGLVGASLAWRKSKFPALLEETRRRRRGRESGRRR